MTNSKPKNIAASVRQRLLNLSRREGEDFQLVLTRYMLERFLFRLSRSHYRDQFILKGAMLFQIWGGHRHRPTRDLDLLGQGPNTAPFLANVFQELCSIDVPDDGLRFAAGSIRADEIKPDDEYQGIRVGLDCRLENARIRLQIDIGFGDVVTPLPEEITFPAILDFETPVLKAYPKESVIAEKLQAMVALGIANSRMKDFYDLWFLSSNFEFNGETLGTAIEKTFKRRQTPIPLTAPIALTDEFGNDSVKVTQWNAFVRKGRLVDDTELKDVVARIWEFIGPLLGDLSENTTAHRTWNPGGPWTR